MYRVDLSLQFESREELAEAERVLAAFKRLKEQGLHTGLMSVRLLHGSGIGREGLTIAEGFLLTMERYKG